MMAFRTHSIFSNNDQSTIYCNPKQWLHQNKEQTAVKLKVSDVKSTYCKGFREETVVVINVD